MANLEDIQERIKSEAQRLWDRIQESSSFNQLKDRFENLSPLAQKAILICFSVLIVVLVAAIPLSSFLSANDSVATYEEQRNLIRDLYKIQQESQNTSGLNPAPSLDALNSQINNELQSALLLPEQIRGVSADSVPSGLPKNHIDGALRVMLNKLNLRQVVDIGYQIMSLHPALKMIDLSIEANAQDSKYFDVIYKFISLKVPVYTPPVAEDEPGKNKKGGKANKNPNPKPNKDNED